MKSTYTDAAVLIVVGGLGVGLLVLEHGQGWTPVIGIVCACALAAGIYILVARLRGREVR